MVELQAIISKILETQHKNIAEQLAPIDWLFQEFDVPEEDIPDLSIGYGFYDNDKKYTLRIVLEKEIE